MARNPSRSPTTGGRPSDPELADLTDAPFELFESERDVLSSASSASC
jgi:hypothetical protein